MLTIETIEKFILENLDSITPCEFCMPRINCENCKFSDFENDHKECICTKTSMIVSNDDFLLDCSHYEPKNTEGIDIIICPYCGCEIPIDTDGGMDFEEENLDSYCRNCKKDFKYSYTTNITYYTTSRGV